MNIKCPHCGTEYDAEENEYGRFVKCAACGKGFVAGTSIAKKLGEAAGAVKDAAKTATNAAYEKARNIDWKAHGERAKAAADAAYDTGKRLYRSALDKFEEWGLRHKFAQFWQLLSSTPWPLQFSSVYISVFGCALAVCNFMTTKSLSSLVQASLIVAIAIAIALTLVRHNFVRWVLIAWGGFNVILLLCGSRDFAFLWPFNICFIVIAILLMIPSAQQWYSIRNRVSNQEANMLSSRRVFACATALALVMGIFLYTGHSSERKKTLESLDGILIEKLDGQTFNKQTFLGKDIYVSSMSPSDGLAPNVNILMDKIVSGQLPTLAEYVKLTFTQYKAMGCNPSLLEEDDDYVTMGASGNGFTFAVKIIRDVKKNRFVVITGTIRTDTAVSAARQTDSSAQRITHEIIRCVRSAQLE